jgi:hypothetical protein
MHTSGHDVEVDSGAAAILPNGTVVGAKPSRHRQTAAVTGLR